MKNRGFTVIELMIVVAITGIVLGAGAPTFTDMITSNTIDSNRDALFTDLRYARTEAVKRGETVGICKSTNLASCNNSAEWANGWIMFEDGNGNGKLDSGDTLLRVHENLGDGISLAFTQDNGSKINFVTYDGLGKTISAIGTYSFSHSSGDTNFNRAITFSTTGRVRKSS